MVVITRIQDIQSCSNYLRWNQLLMDFQERDHGDNCLPATLEGALPTHCLEWAFFLCTLSQARTVITLTWTYFCVLFFIYFLLNFLFSSLIPFFLVTPSLVCVVDDVIKSKDVYYIFIIFVCCYEDSPVSYI